MTLSGPVEPRASPSPPLVPLVFGCVLPDRFVAGAVDRTVFALFLGVALCVSALPVIVMTLSDMRLLHRNFGQLTPDRRPDRRCRRVAAVVGLRMGVLNGETYTLIVPVAIVTSLMAPPIIRAASARIDQTGEERLREEEFTDQIDQR